MSYDTKQDTIASQPYYVKVVVGGATFVEKTTFLRSVSNYFDRAIAKDTFQKDDIALDSLEYTFPGRQPQDWKLIRSFLVPFSTAELTLENWEKVLSWSAELLIDSGLKCCDDFLLKKLNEKSYDDNNLAELMMFFKSSVDRNLPLSKEKSIEIVTELVVDGSINLRSHRSVVNSCEVA